MAVTSLSASGGAAEARRMRSLLADRPDVKELLRSRMEQFPEYAAFVRNYGTGVLAVLEDGKPARS